MTDIGDLNLDLNLALDDLGADCILLVRRAHHDPPWTATAIAPVPVLHARHGRGHTATEALCALVKACGR